MHTETMKNHPPVRTRKTPPAVLAKRIIRYIPIFILLVLFAFLLLAPLLWMCLGAFKSDPEVLSYPPRFFPVGNNIPKNWENVLKQIDFWGMTVNTAVYAIGTTIPAMLVNALAGYAFARFRFRGKNVLFLLFLATMMIPFQVIMIPLFVEEYMLGILNTLPGLVLPRMSCAYGIFMMRTFFRSLPRNLEEAARIDGENEIGIYFRIMLPLARPGIVALGIYLLMTNWNDLTYPLILTTDAGMRTLPAGIAMFVGNNQSSYYGPMIAATVVSIAPLLLLYLFLQRQFITGIAMSGMKD